MPANICIENQKKLNRNGSILFRKAEAKPVTTTNDTTKLKRSFSAFSKIVASVSTKRKVTVTTMVEDKEEPVANSQRAKAARPLSQFYYFSSASNRVEQEHNTNTNTILVMEEQNDDETQRQQIKRHSTALDFMTPRSISSSSSSLRTLKEEQEEEQEKKKCSRNTKRLVSVARARTVLGLDSLKSKENRAIRVWKTTISQQLTEQEKHHYHFYKIVSHPTFTAKKENTGQEAGLFVRHAMIKFIVNELVETENSYNKLLKLIQHRYMQPMVAASQSKDPLVKSTDIPILFKHLNELVQLSDKLIFYFQSTKRKEDVNIGYLFRSLESDLVVFLKYVMHYKINIKTIKRACNNVLFIKIDQENLSRRDTNRLGMADYLIAPIQRIPRYCLLIKDLQKHYNPSDPTLNDLNLALKILTGLAIAMDSVTSKSPPTRNYTL